MVSLDMDVNKMTSVKTTGKKGRAYQEIISDRFLRRHAPCILRCSLKDTISPPGTDDSIICNNAVAPTIFAVAAGDSATTAGVFTKLKDSGNIAAAVAIVWSRPDSDDTAIKHLFVSLHNKLVGPRYKRQAVEMVELFDDIAAEEEPSPTRTQPPAFDLIWI